MKINRITYKDVEKHTKIKIKTSFKNEFFGTTPAPFVGRFGYPNINVGILSPQITAEAKDYNSPHHWAQTNAKIDNIASKRYELVNARAKTQVKEPRAKVVDVAREAAMASAGAEVEVSLQKTPALFHKPDTQVSPFGPQVSVDKARLTNNPKVANVVEKAVSDTDLKAASAIQKLYLRGIEEDKISSVLSVATLGVEKNRKLVPTRWSITAVDDTIAKALMQEVKNYEWGEYQAYFGGGWGNYYLYLTFPEPFSYELFETYLKSKINPWSKQNHAYATDYEPHKGRTKYAEETAGGYYAARLPVLEMLKKQKRQTGVLALRFITDDYHVPLGVWVCRESARKSLQAKPLTFSSKELMLRYAQLLIKKKFNFDINHLLVVSKLLKAQQQKTLTSFA